MNADPVVMADLGGPFGQQASDAKLERFEAAFITGGIGRWVIESLEDGTFLGYAGLMPHGPDHPLGPHHDIGWRLTRDAWGCGFASQAARLALTDAFDRMGLDEVLAYTTPTNERSQAVMARLGLHRDASRDFDMCDDVLGTWHSLVWVATRST